MIRAGNGVSSKPYLDNTLYTKHLEGRTVHGLDIPAMLKEHIDAVLECVSNYNYQLLEIIFVIDSYFLM